MNIAHTKEYFYKNLRFPLVLDDLRFSRDNCSQAHSRSPTEWEAKAIACQETWEMNGYECRVARNQKVGLLAIADTKVILQDRATCRLTVITRSNFVVYVERRKAITSDNFPLLIT